MNDNKHTPEPWRTAERSGFPFHIDDARGESVAMMLADDDHDEQRGLDNALRIVACVNACAGIGTDALESEGSAVMGWNRTARKLIDVAKQRDELLAALIHIQQVACSGSPELGIATDAIASVKGEAK